MTGEVGSGPVDGPDPTTGGEKNGDLRPAPTPAGRRKLWAVAIVAALVFAGDQTTKRIVRATIEPGEVITVAACCMNWTHIHNRGGAFGMFAGAARDGWGKKLFSAASLAALGFLLYLIVVTPPGVTHTLVALAAILGGAVGNLWDRLLQGYVVDFIDLHARGWHWPSFNVADMAITVGIAFVLLDSFRGRTKVL
ncbi:MAG: signal peptidase II [Nitrospirae bacterium]|nr:signal peptidase II [Nitrospirota bacterium]